MPRSIITCLLFVLTCHFAAAQSIYTNFGKNRVQYHDDFDNWWMYETENFVVYWYGKGRNVAETVVQTAELDFNRIQNVLEHRFNDKIQIVVYTDLSDLKQTNIGNEEQFSSKSARTRVLDNKMFVYFDGDHQNLRRSIRQGVASVYLDAMLFGSNFQEVVQNAVLLHLPEWFKDGLVTYLGSEWDATRESEFRDLFMMPNGKFKDFDYMARDYPELAGHAMWYYIGRAYGKSSIANLLYLSRINRSYESAFLYVLGKDFDRVCLDWARFYEGRYDKDEDEITSHNEDNVVPIRNKKNRPYSSLTIHPDGGILAYATNDQGKIKVYLRDLETGDKIKLLKTGTRDNVSETDFNYPLMAWHPSGNAIAIVYERRDVIYLQLSDLQGEIIYHEPIGVEYQRVYSIDFWHQDTLIFNANTDGFSDLYKFIPKNRQSIRITEDFYDDLDAKVFQLADTKGILFSSNRTNLAYEKRDLDTLLPLENYDIYFMFPQGKRWELLNLTQTPYDNERQPLAIGPRSIIFLSDESGLWNRKAIHGPLSDQKDIDYFSKYSRGIIGHTAAPGLNTIYEHMIYQGKHIIVESQPGEVEPIVIIREGQFGEDGQSRNMDDRDVVDDRYLFQSRFAKPKDETAPVPAPEERIPADTVTQIPIEFLRTPSTDENPVMYDPSKVIEFNPSRAIAHRLRFKLDFANITLDNSLLFTELDLYGATRQQYEPPPLGILLRARIKDLFEDFVIEGGARYPTTFNGSEYYLYLDSRKKRIDKRFALYRKAQTNDLESMGITPERIKYVTIIGLARATYPFDAYRSVHLTGSLRNDRTSLLATNQVNLEVPNDDQQRIGLKLEYIFDNTLDLGVNMKQGTRYKAWVELVKRFDLNLFESDPATFNDGFMTVLGLDARHYVRLDRHSIFAARFYGATTFGSERNLYYLGGVENWFFNEFDNTIPVPDDKNFAYQTIAANMRGFKYNARNGSSVALINTELRVPIIRYFSKRKIRSSLFRNMQVVGFVDVGTAWHGSNPFSSENPLNTTTLTNPPTVVVDVKYYRNPVVVGYGGGIRTMILGYFLKLDYAWGWDTNRVNSPILYFSMGTDF